MGTALLVVAAVLFIGAVVVFVTALRRPKPKLRLLKWANPGVGLGVRWFRWWLLWLRGDGEGDGGVEEVEGAALVGGGFGEHGHLDGGAVVAELVAGEGGQVIE